MSADTVLTLHASHSHLFPGARLHLREGHGLPGHSTEVLVVFSDESVAEAEITDDTPHAQLRVEPYTTGSGTTIPAKTWLLSRGDASAGGFRVVGRAGDTAEDAAGDT